MGKFPPDAPKSRVLRALERLGFRVVKIREHIALQRENMDGSVTPMTIPNHSLIKGTTLQTACRMADVTRDDFVRAYEES